MSVLKRYEDALEYYDKALLIDPNYSRAWYNKACVESLRNNKQESINYLKKVIELDENIIEKAKLEADFDNIRDSEEFKELIG
ncbi:MAG: tetratricopeptide repeat protein [Candidatus Helarchaeota archaeon]|nr:tetratricopeptide repeat protein [Candidatus Helarchaeota archaeon]